MRSFWKTFVPYGALFSALVFTACAANYDPSPIVPPRVPREFRGVWIATVANIDWPSKPGLTTAEQKAELITLLDHAARLKLNAVIFQVRPACDAFYASPFEPWSAYLTGTMGKAPSPFYDPLAFAVEEAHRRGLELHAWFNPYRALHRSHSGAVATNHVSRTRPHLVKKWGDYLWLDPGEREVQDYSLRAILDVVRRYDIDGVQIDDYFYPDRDGPTRGMDFPDEASWRKFGSGQRDDWRRENVNTFVQRLYSSIKSVKPWVKFGVSPRGIWRPGNPPQIEGSDDYAENFADTRKWFMNGWLDYFSPQLYWSIDKRAQSFPVLLNWWSQQNAKNRHLWPGLAAYKFDYRAGNEVWTPPEIPNQIQLTRENSGSTGYILYNMKHVRLHAPLSASLERSVNRAPALVPASPWLGNVPPRKPNVSAGGNAAGTRLTWSASGTNSPVRWWMVQTEKSTVWQTEILPANITSKTFTAPPDAVAVTAIDRAGNASPPAVLHLRKTAEPRILLRN